MSILAARDRCQRDGGIDRALYRARLEDYARRIDSQGASCPSGATAHVLDRRYPVPASLEQMILVPQDRSLLAIVSEREPSALFASSCHEA